MSTGQMLFLVPNQQCQSTETFEQVHILKWLSSRVVSMLDSDEEGLGFKLQLRRCRVTVLGKLFTPIV